MIKIARYL